MEWTQTLLAGMKLNTPGATEEALTEAAEDLDHELPKDLIELLKAFNGGKGALGVRQVELWNLETIVDENIAQEVVAATPGLLLIGTDTGTEGIGYLAQRYAQKPWGRISLMAGGGDEFEPLAATLSDLFDALAHGR